MVASDLESNYEDAGDGAGDDAEGSDVAVLAPGIGKTSRSFVAIPERYYEMTRIAQKVVADYTLYQKLLLTAGETILLIQHAWNKAQTGNCQVERVRAVESYVSSTYSIYSRRITNLH